VNADLGVLLQNIQNPILRDIGGLSGRFLNEVVGDLFDNRVEHGFVEGIHVNDSGVSL
jgi:hypothetical protein